MLLNLLNNAFYAVHQKALAAGADYKPVVEISTTAKDNHLLITITDNGSGIAEDIKDKIMQPFFTTKPTGEGTGLGLSLSYDIVTNSYGGKITADSIVNEGSTFVVSLPLYSK